jgi:hypothetical protein
VERAAVGDDGVAHRSNEHTLSEACCGAGEQPTPGQAVAAVNLLAGALQGLEPVAGVCSDGSGSDGVVGSTPHSGVLGAAAEVGSAEDAAGAQVDGLQAWTAAAGQMEGDAAAAAAACERFVC